MVFVKGVGGLCAQVTDRERMFVGERWCQILMCACLSLAFHVKIVHNVSLIFYTPHTFTYQVFFQELPRIFFQVYK